jgi:F-type H+-transporting ATPase subunit gamma
MPSLKEVRNRIKSVQSTQQITKAMKMVAAAKLRRAQDQAMQLRPYASKLNEILNNLASNSESLATNPFTEVRIPKKILIVVVTSDRGLCGPFNTNVMKATNALLAGKYASQLATKEVTFLTIGKKGFEYYGKRYESVIGDYSTLFTALTFDKVKQAAEFAMQGFVAGNYDVVEIVYNQFKNVATQIVQTERFLPISSELPKESKSTVKKDYIFEPNVDGIIEELIPRSLKTKFYTAVLESNASEHGARMSAMDKATENAGEMLKALKIQYNRSRQASITNEILEIVAGAEALSA